MWLFTTAISLILANAPMVKPFGPSYFNNVARSRCASHLACVGKDLVKPDLMDGDPVNSEEVSMNTKKSALITGGYSPLGVEIASLLGANGYDLVLMGRNKNKLDTAVVSLSEKHPAIEVDSIVCSLGSSTLEELKQDEQDWHERCLRVVVNNAGLWSDSNFLDVSVDEMKQHFELVIGTTLLTQDVVGSWVDNNTQGCIVNIGSLWAERSLKEAPCVSHAMGKAAIHQLTRNLAEEFGDKGIRTLTVVPAVLSPEASSMGEMHTIGRIGTYQEVAEAVLFATQASFTTGTTIHVDGGASTRLRGF